MTRPDDPLWAAPWLPAVEPEEDTTCVCCARPTVETDDPNNPLRRTLQGEACVYILCARCETVAKQELSNQEGGA